MASSEYTERVRAGVGHGLLIHPGVAIVVHDSAGRLLFVRSTQSGEWGIPAGGIELGESPLAAARRELWEESGIDCDDLALAAALGGPTFQHTYPNGDEVEYAIFVFSGRGPGASALVPNDTGEVSEARFFSRNEAPSLALPYPPDLLWRG